MEQLKFEHATYDVAAQHVDSQTPKISPKISEEYVYHVTTQRHKTDTGFCLA